ncbi:MAG: glycosyltransferase family 4 protein [Candidatus Magasanikbacteria bacterium]
MKKKIAIDARMMSSNFGIGRYIQQLVKNLESEAPGSMEFFLFMKQENWGEFEPDRENFNKIEADVYWYGTAEQIKMPKIINKVDPDLVHFPHWNIPVFYSGDFVVTIHDLIMFHFPRPEATTHGRVKYWLKDKIHRYVVKKAVANSKAVITPSKFTKEDVLDNFHISEDKISVTYQAPFSTEDSSEDFSSLESKFGVDKPFVFYVGSAYPHKNLKNLLKAWKIFKKEDTDKNKQKKYQLILAGKKDYFYSKLTNSELFQKAPDVKYIGKVSNAELISLYDNAALFVFPSLYEGFGLPLLESLREQTPVLTSKKASIPEVLGDVGIYTDTTNPNKFSKDIETVLENEELRKEKLKQVDSLLDNYSWQELAKDTLEVYKNN